jgi:hypothetical protein
MLRSLVGNKATQLERPKRCPRIAASTNSGEALMLVGTQFARNH